jgi:SNF2 family DNA or RNA helicase
MLVLHAALLNDSIALWAEAPPAAIPQPAKRGRRPRYEIPPPPQHGAPFALVREAIGSTGIELPSEERKLVAWLPSLDGRPGASTPLAGQTLPPGFAEIAPFHVEALVATPGDALAFLATLVGQRLVAPGIVVGADLAFLVTAMRYAAALTVRGHVLPSLEEALDGFHARWTVAPAPDERRELGSLAAAIPPSALALGTKLDTPPPVERRRAVSRYLDAIADSLLRRLPPSGTKPASIHDRWIAALTSRDARMAGDSAELSALAKSIREWRRPVAQQALFDFRIAFRLEEPAGDGEEWIIRILLQGVDDPSLIFPLAVIRSESRTPESRAARRLLRRHGDEAMRYVYASLAQASALSPAADRALRDGGAGIVRATTQEAFSFLSSEAALLQGAGFGVFLPGWWSGRKRRLSLRASTPKKKFASSGRLSLSDLVDVRWSVALGGEEMTLAELRTLARLKAPLVRIRGEWVQLTPEEIEEALRFAKAKGAKLPLGALLHASLSGTVPGAGQLQLDELDASGPLQELLDRLQGRREWNEIPPPEELEATLRPYQLRGYSWLDFLTSAGFGGCLADDMGLGKTVQTLALVQKRWNESRAPFLLVCPTSVTGNWIREAARFTPRLPVLLHHGSGRRRGAAFAKEARKHALVVSSYSLLTRDSAMLQEIEWQGVVLDEAQNIKNYETKQSRAARSIEAPVKIALTGTPVENNIGDLYSILDFLNPGFLGTPTSFRQRFFLPIQTMRDGAAIESLRKISQPFILRRLKTDRSIISDLPAKNEMKVFCTLTREQATLYEAVANEAQQEIAGAEGISRKGLILATIMKLKQVCNHPRQLLADGSPLPGRSGKMARLEEMLTEAVESGDRALVFTQFAEMGTLLQTHLQEQFGVEVLFLHGGTPRSQRDSMIERFQEDGDGPPLFILSLKAGGTGINLTRANHVFHFDRWWNPAVENQATDRAFRIGQKRSVQVHKFICGGTFEEKIDEMIEAKSELASKVVGSGEGWLTELSNRELRELFTLRADAVGE